MSLCQNPVGERHEIPAGGRRIGVPALTIAWGAGDLRDDWTGGYEWCSFACLAAWATEKAAQHDGRVLLEGTPDAG